MAKDRKVDVPNEETMPPPVEPAVIRADHPVHDEHPGDAHPPAAPATPATPAQPGGGPATPAIPATPPLRGSDKPPMVPVEHVPEGQEPLVAPGAVGPVEEGERAAVVLHPPTNVDPEHQAQLDRIADLERQIEEEKRNERRRLVDAEKEQFKTGLDQREAELRAQLARVRGEDVVDEPHEE